MSFETIVLCDLSNVIKRILVVNVACDYKLVTKINRRKTFFYQCIGLSCARIILKKEAFNLDYVNNKNLTMVCIL
jgi:hypothetical protein